MTDSGSNPILSWWALLVLPNEHFLISGTTSFVKPKRHLRIEFTRKSLRNFVKDFEPTGCTIRRKFDVIHPLKCLRI